MTFDDRTAALAPLGFTTRQRQFLVIVALHGGHCVPRQYAAFAHVHHGGTVHRFFHRLGTQALVRRVPCRADRGAVYHLWPSHVYDALGEPDNRNRRRVSVALVARKLMVLDFILGEAPADWLGTEDDKVRLFRETLDVAEAYLPQRLYRSRQGEHGPTRRFFIHKLPITRTPDGHTVVFVYLAVDDTGRGFSQFLHDHRRLLGAVPRWRIVAVSGRGTAGLVACRRIWHRLGRAEPARPRETTDPDLDYLIHLKQRLEAGQGHAISQADYDRWRRLSHRFGGASIDALIARWQPASADSACEMAGLQSAIEDGRADLVTHQLPQSYDRFGSRPGIA